MRVTLAHIAAHNTSTRTSPISSAVDQYLARIRPWADAASSTFPSEARLLDSISTASTRTRPLLCLLDARGRQFTSEQFAQQISRWQDSGLQHLYVAIGPHDGWSAAARDRAALLLSLGPMTLAHSVARLVAAEQLYRAFAILAGHPYHSGH